MTKSERDRLEMAYLKTFRSINDDTRLLDWLADNRIIEGFVSVPHDVHEYALIAAGENAPEGDDAEAWEIYYRIGLRNMIQDAMKATEKSA